MYKVSNNVPFTILRDIFTSGATPYNLLTQFVLKCKNILSFTEILSHLAPTVWSLVTQEIGSLYYLVILNQKLKKRTRSNCPCRLCEKYLSSK